MDDFGASDKSDRAGHEQSQQAVSAVPVAIPSAVTLVFQRDIIRSVPERWREQYEHGSFHNDQGKQDIQRQLDALDIENASKEQIARIIGNTSWTENACYICGNDVEVSARIGEEPDYEARWIDFCLPCLAELGQWAAQAIETRRAETERLGAQHESAVRKDASTPNRHPNGNSNA